MGLVHAFARVLGGPSSGNRVICGLSPDTTAMCGFSSGNKTFIYRDVTFSDYVNLSISYTLVEICEVDECSVLDI